MRWRASELPQLLVNLRQVESLGTNEMDYEFAKLDFRELWDEPVKGVVVYPVQQTFVAPCHMDGG